MREKSSKVRSLSSRLSFLFRLAIQETFLSHPVPFREKNFRSFPCSSSSRHKLLELSLLDPLSVMPRSRESFVNQPLTSHRKSITSRCTCSPSSGIFPGSSLSQITLCLRSSPRHQCESLIAHTHTQAKGRRNILAQREPHTHTHLRLPINDRALAFCPPADSDPLVVVPQRFSPCVQTCRQHEEKRRRRRRRMWNWEPKNP